MNKSEIFGYLLVTARSLKNYDVIAKEYWISVTEMNRENRLSKTNYACQDVCLELSWRQRKKLSCYTGIPMKNIINVGSIDDKIHYLGFNTIINIEAKEDDFFGRTKVFDTEENIPRSEISSGIEVVYEY